MLILDALTATTLFGLLTTKQQSRSKKTILKRLCFYFIGKNLEEFPFSSHIRIVHIASYIDSL